MNLLLYMAEAPDWGDFGAKCWLTKEALLYTFKGQRNIRNSDTGPCKGLTQYITQGFDIKRPLSQVKYMLGCS